MKCSSYSASTYIKKYSNSTEPMVFTEREWIGSFISKWPISEYLFLQISLYL